MVDSKSFETALFCFLFVINIAGLGFLIAVVIKAIGFYIGSPVASTYSYLVQTQLFAPQHILEYLLTAAVFVFIALIIVYVWKQNRSIIKMIFRK